MYLKSLIVLFLIATLASCRKVTPCEPKLKFDLPNSPLTEVIAGDTNAVYFEAFDSVSANHQEYIRLDSVEESCGLRMRISDQINGSGNISIVKSIPGLSFCVENYVDTTYLSEYVQTWEQKRDSVTMYTSYPHNGAQVFSTQTKQYIKVFKSDDVIQSTNDFAEAPASIFERTNRITLEGPVEVDGMYVFEKEIYDLKTEHIDFGEDFYVGFKYETETSLQMGYIHLEIYQEFGINGEEIYFKLFDWGIRQP